MSHPLRVVLKRGKSKPFWLGHPWVFSGAIHAVEGDAGDTGAACLVEDDRGNVLGSGFYNPQARIAVRLLQHRRTTDLPFDPRPFLDVVGERLDAAVATRAALGLPADGTTAYRVVNAEGDGLPGLIVDRLGPVASIQLGWRAMYEAREALAARVAERLGVDAVAVGVSEDASRMEAIPAGTEVLRGALPGPVEVLEDGLRYRVDVVGGQKTGFYADQRENRRRFAALCAGREVLDLYSYVGGFGLQAARAGARGVTCVDASGPAVQAVGENAALNGLSERVAAVQADAMSFLKEARAQGRLWERVVCDPPKLARGRAHLEDAIKRYARLNTLAMATVAPGGLLLTCSCSQHVDEDAFLRMLTDAGHRLRRTVHVHAVWGQGPDHPFSVVAPEGRYLTAVLLSTSEG